MNGEDPMGKEIRVDGEHYTVIGVGERKGKTLGQSQDNWVAVPLTTFLDTYGANNRSLTLYARAYGVGDPLELASDEVRAILRSHRHDRPGAEDSFSVDTNRPSSASGRASAPASLRVCLACRHLAGRRRHRHHEHHAGLA